MNHARLNGLESEPLFPPGSPSLLNGAGGTGVVGEVSNNSFVGSTVQVSTECTGIPFSLLRNGEKISLDCHQPREYVSEQG